MQPKFKPYNQGQIELFPQRLDDFIEENHPVRLVNQVVDELDLTSIIKTYKGGGTTSFCPRMMIKVLFYAYMRNIYSCRKIEAALKENVHFLWLSGKQFPDFRTINDFRSKRLKHQIHKVFGKVVEMLVDLKYVSLDVQYIDGTKIESVANRYSFVWRKSVERNKLKLQAKIGNIIQQIEQGIREDNRTVIEIPAPIDSKTLKERIREINESEKLEKEQEKQIKELQQAQAKLEEYENHLETLGERNSYSKTDPDATFMRMKEDQMGNTELKPAYNAQISTENQFVTNFGLYQEAGDTTTLIPHLDSFEEKYKSQSKEVVADSGYGSEQNFDHMERNGIENFVKFNYFHREQKQDFKNNPSKVENLHYNQEGDFFICPMGQKMHFIGTEVKESVRGYKNEIFLYQAGRCSGCSMRCVCHKAKGNRIIEVNHNLRRHKEIARKNLNSEEGLQHRSRRPVEVEAVFGQIKSNKGFRRFHLKGLEGATIEFGLICIALNLSKMIKQGLGKGQKPSIFLKKWFYCTPLTTRRKNYAFIIKNLFACPDSSLILV